MKKLLLLCLAVIPMMVFGQKAKIEFEKTSHNFGKISETGGNAVYDFAFKNTGTAPLILTNVRAGCGCTTPEWSREPIAPNANGHIRVSFNPLHRSGPFTKSVTVNSNAENAVVSLTIRGTIEKEAPNPYAAYVQNVGGLKLTAANINLGTVKNTETPERTIGMINSGAQPLTVTVTSSTPYITVTANPATLESNQKGTLTVKFDAKARNEWGFISDRLTVATDHGNSYEMPLVANITEDFSGVDMERAPAIEFSEGDFDLGIVAAGTIKKHEFKIKNTGKSDLIIRKIRTSDEQFTVVPAKMVVKPGREVKVTATFKAEGTPGKKSKIVSFTVNDPKNPLVSYRLAGTIQ